MEERTIEMVWRCSSCRVVSLGRYTTCTGCGNPKDDSEAYEMPGDVDAAATVVDPDLLRLADAGENWRCRYCQSHQRRLDGTCGACGADQGEGGEARDGKLAAAAPRQASAKPFCRDDDEPIAVDPDPLGRRARAKPFLLFLAGALALVMAVGVFAALRPEPPPPQLQRALASHLRVIEAPVTGRSWEHRVYVDRWQKVAHEGFAELRPTDAVDVVSLGQKQHHTERVLAGYRTETYSERVSDGSTTETYSATESCGQTCTSRPQTCREVCSSSKNGFAKCRQQCSGGGQTCTSKTCTVQKTRSVPRYKDVTRTRQVPQYRDEPRFQPFFGWKLWQWVENRRVMRRGSTEPPAWPSPEELKAKDKLAEGERERDRREPSYGVTVSPPGHGALALSLASAEELELASQAKSLPVYLTPAGEVGLLGSLQTP